MNDLDRLCVNTIRFLALDAVELAKSGHPGTPLGAAPIAYVVFDRILRHDPTNPKWPNRDRFVLSAGHASALLYALLHLTGYDLTLEDLRSFRQLGSRTPGHPEYGRTPGVEATTGPLGQGFANAVGMAMAERWLASHYNRAGFPIVDHFTYVLASDGDMQEGVTAEAASLAGTMRLGKLIVLYDSNRIQIEGSTDLAFTEDVACRFSAYGWQVLGPVDANALDDLQSAIHSAQNESARPSLIICESRIGYGSPVEGTAAAHGEPLGQADAAATKARLGWTATQSFCVPDAARTHMRQSIDRGRDWKRDWDRLIKKYSLAYPELASEFLDQIQGRLPSGWDSQLEALFPHDRKPISTREAVGRILNTLSKRIHAVLGGSADLSPSTRTSLAEGGDFAWNNYCGHNIHFGVREHAMAAVVNGMTLHGGCIPYAATFLVFSDYMRPALRLAALMRLREVFIFTHDSIALGQDGPTHQPIEHLMSLRLIPNLTVIRPCDGPETIEAFRAALLNDSSPTAIIVTRQPVPTIDRSFTMSAEGTSRGAYILWQSASKEPDLILLSSGSEVPLCLAAAQRIATARNASVRVVSMPSWELFQSQTQAYRERILPRTVNRRLSVEAGTTIGWERFVGPDGHMLGIDTFGDSGPGDQLMKQRGFTVEDIVQLAERMLEDEPRSGSSDVSN